MTLQRTLPVQVVATPVLARVPSLGPGPRFVSGEVWGGSRAAAHLAMDGFVVTVTGRTTPLLPNALVVGADDALRTFARGSRVVFEPGRIGAAGTTLVWDPACPPCWDPTVPAAPVFLPALRRRAGALWQLLGLPSSARSDPDGITAALARRGLAAAGQRSGARGMAILLSAVTERDPALAGGAAKLLAGRGPGLTPEGDDILAGCAITLAALGGGLGWSSVELAAWRRALGTHRARTTALSQTLLELASRGGAPEPIHRLLDLSTSAEGALRGAFERLLRLGHSTGLALAGGVAATLSRLALR